METLYLLLPLSLIFVLVIGLAFWWAVSSGQFEGSDEAARSILLDDDSTAESPSAASREDGGETDLLHRSGNKETKK